MWDIRYRPLQFSDVLGQEGAVKVLKSRLAKKTGLDTSYIFAGGHGQGKCVVGSTLVSTDKGLIPIKDLMGVKKIEPCDITVLQETGSSKAAYTYQGGLRDTLAVKTHKGFQIEGTANHRILVMSPSGKPDWKRLDELKLGDWACLLPKALYGSDVSFPHFSYERPSPLPSFHLPGVMTPDLGRLLGYMTGDGTGPGVLSVLSCAEPDVIQDQLKLMKDLLGSSSSTPDKRRKSLVSIRCFRKEARSFLEHAGYSYAKAALKEVPWSVLRSSKETVREFLRGYFESDGGPIQKSLTVEYCSKSEVLARQIHLLLLQFGVLGRVFAKKHPKYGVYWRCQVYGSEIVNFSREIGFLSKRKQEVLSKILLKCKGLTRSVPYQKLSLRRYYAGLPVRNRITNDLFRSRRPSYIGEIPEGVLRLALKHHPKNSVSSEFEDLLLKGFVYDKITSIKASEALVYDLNVPDGERFLANGFVNHNTTIGRILGRALLCQNLTEDFEPCNQCDNCKDVLAESSSALSEMDAASRGTVEHARSIVENLEFVVLGAPKKIFIFDEVHRMSKEAQDVLLKPLEDKRFVGIFCTTEPEKIRGPIRSRCEEYLIRKVTREDVLSRMKWVLSQERVEYEDDAVLTVIDHSGGHVRDVLNKLEMIGQLGPITLEAVREHLHLSVISTYYQILLNLQNPRVSISLAEEACERVGPEGVAEGLAEAAMNSYRLANGMLADFTFTDRGLSEQVHGLYGSSVTKLSEYFLRSYRISRISLLSDILACAGGIPSASAGNSVVQIQLAGPAVVPVVSAASQPPQEVRTPLPPPPAVPTGLGTPVAPATPKPVVLQSKVVGNALPGGGYNPEAPMALTSLDMNGVPATVSRPRDSLPAIPQTSSKENFLSASEWKQKFLLKCATLSPKGV